MSASEDRELEALVVELFSDPPPDPVGGAAALSARLRQTSEGLSMGAQASVHPLPASRWEKEVIEARQLWRDHMPDGVLPPPRAYQRAASESDAQDELDVLRRELKRIVPPAPEENPDAAPLLDQILDKLTPHGGCILAYLWAKKTAGFDALASIPGAFRVDPPQDETIAKALKRISEDIEKMDLRGGFVTLSVSTAKRRATLERPPDK